MSTISSITSSNGPATLLRAAATARTRNAAAFASADIASSTAAGEGLVVDPIEPVAIVTGRGTSQPDTVELSPLATAPAAAAVAGTKPACDCGKAKCNGACKTAIGGSAAGTGELSDEQKQQIEKLKTRDAHVKQHEAAHLAAAGSLARSGPKYEYTKGPDGKQYAVGGHVDIDTSPGATPQETIAKAQRIKAAANAPSDPSGQDQSVAAAAGALEAKARSDQAQAAAQNTGGGGAAPVAGAAKPEPKARPAAAPATAPTGQQGAQGQPAQAFGPTRSEQPVQAIGSNQRRQSKDDDAAASAFAALVKNAYAATSGATAGSLA